MDSTPPIKLSASKLPVKRKTPDYQQFLSPNFEDDCDDPIITTLDFPDPTSKPPPFKFHRIWTEPDEIRFLRGLLQSDGLSFPRDLPIFYSHFSSSMSRPYTKSQLSEKLRRLRKKFRVISSRLARGLDPSALSAHDRALFDLSTRLWSPEFSDTSPSGKNSSSADADPALNPKKKTGAVQSNGNLVGVNVFFSPVLPISSNQIRDKDNNGNGAGVDNDEGCYVNGDYDQDVKMGSINKDHKNSSKREEGIGGVTARSVLKVFNECVKEGRMVLVRQGLLSSIMKEGREKDFERRWKEQRVAELDVLARRLRLVLESSVKVLGQ